MSGHPSCSCPVDSNALLLLAWFSTRDVRALIERKKREQQWKHPPQLLEETLRASIDEALACFQDDPIYGPAFLHLARYRLAGVDLQSVAWAIDLEGLVDPSNGVFFSDDPYSSVDGRQKEGPADETEAFWQVVTAHVPLAERLQRLSQAWHGDVCRGTCELQAFFNWYLDIVQRPLRVPFFLHELLRASVARIDWHLIAAQILQVPSCRVCQCEARRREEPRGARAEFLGELFRLVGDEIVQHSQNLPEPQRTLALFLLDLCRETTKSMRSLTPTGA
jgi:hypothetical protein